MLNIIERINMQVDPLILFAIYLVAVIALGCSLYALVVLKEVKEYYRNYYRHQYENRNTKVGYSTKRK